MTIIPAGASSPRPGPAEWFSGSVSLEEIGPEQLPVRVVRVAFAPRARTAWHTHPHGQLLQISSGTARVQVAGDAIREVQAGDVVWFAPGERHWHGAAPGTIMVHLAIQQADASGVATRWLEQVSDAEYDAVTPQV